MSLVHKASHTHSREKLWNNIAYKYLLTTNEMQSNFLQHKIIKSRPRSLSHLLYPLDWTYDVFSWESQASVPEISEQHEGFELQRERKTQHLCGVMSYRQKEQGGEKSGARAFRSARPHYLCIWMQKWICKPSLKQCSDMKHTAGNWFTSKVETKSCFIMFGDVTPQWVWVCVKSKKRFGFSRPGILCGILCQWEATSQHFAIYKTQP